MKAQIKRVALIVVGWLFLIVGIAGLFLPFVQGILFILIGLLILSTEYVWAHHLLHKLRTKFPRIAHMVDVAEERGRAWIYKLSHRRHPRTKPVHVDD